MFFVFFCVKLTHELCVFVCVCVSVIAGSVIFEHGVPNKFLINFDSPKGKNLGLFDRKYLKFDSRANFEVLMATNCEERSDDLKKRAAGENFWISRLFWTKNLHN